MERRRKQARTTWTRCKAMLIAAGIGTAVAACGDRDMDPAPSGSPPRPMTQVNHVVTAQLDMAARPVLPAPGPM